MQSLLRLKNRRKQSRNLKQLKYPNLRKKHLLQRRQLKKQQR